MLASEKDRVFDVAIVGGGPAGLTAAIYLSRFLRSVVVLDGGNARAALIPLSRNCPGFPEGIGGEELLRRLRQQANDYGAETAQESVTSIEASDGSFTLSTTSGMVQASFVILATGIVDKAPAIPDLRECIATALVRLCPVCDAYEAVGKKIGVVGPAHAALTEALFLRDYSSDVCILARGREDIGKPALQKAAGAGIEFWDYASVNVGASRLEVVMRDGTRRPLNIIYSAMGCDVRSELATSLGVDCDATGYILVGAHLETSVPGLYAIGDVAKALNQIAVGFGHAALAAAQINSALSKRGSFDPMRIRA